jgi:hypothetical protein
MAGLKPHGYAFAIQLYEERQIERRRGVGSDGVRVATLATAAVRRCRAIWLHCGAPLLLLCGSGTAASFAIM